jgi:response regulator RpfG family c-di-GMP phosphodiesterase
MKPDNSIQSQPGIDNVQQLRRAVDELTLLNDLSLKISASLDTTVIIETIIRSCLQAVYAEQGLITLVDKEASTTETLARITVSTSRSKAYSLNPVVLGWIHIYKKPLVLNNPRDDVRFGMIKWSDSIRSLLSVPLMIKSSLIGVLTVFNKKSSDGFSEDDLRLLTIIAGQSAQVIESARLHEQGKTLTRGQEELRGQLQESYLDTIHKLVIAAEYRDPETGNHILRIGLFSELIAQKLELPPKEVRTIRYAAPMHDVGKIGIPDSILLKKGKLTEIEDAIMKGHTFIGEKILANSKGEILQVAQQIALTHHERWDGKGYPGGLRGDEIPLVGRIVTLVDAFDALTSNRPYKKAISVEEACEIILKERGLQFDPQLVDLFIRNIDEVKRIRAEVKEK